MPTAPPSRACSFADAARDFELRNGHEGMHVFAVLPPHPPSFPREVPPPAPFSRGARPLPPPEGVRTILVRSSGPAIVDGVVTQSRTMRDQFQGHRFGFAVATLFGVRAVPPKPFMNGLIGFTADPALFQNIAIGLIVLVLLTALVVGGVAAIVGRYITEQAIRPLVDVTQALAALRGARFSRAADHAGGRSDFDVLADAYNAAAAQVAAAFAEREAAEAQMRQFVADAGHELRTPLTIVLGYIDLLRRRAGEGDERARSSSRRSPPKAGGCER